MDAQNTIHPIFKWVAEEDDAKTNNKIILTHVAFKGAQTGSIAMALFQFLYFRRRIRVIPFYKGQIYSTFGTSIGSVGAAYYMIKTSDPVRNYDRAFRSPPHWPTDLLCACAYGRIQHNSLQNRCDKYSVMLSGSFAFLSLFIWPIPTWVGWQTFEKMLGFWCFGFGFGAFGHWITKNGNRNPDLINWWKD